MSVWMRRVAWSVAGLLLVLGAVATWFVLTFDAERTKALAVDWMKQQRNRTLAIGGPIELSVFPRLAVKLSKVRLSEAGKPDEFASLDQAGLALDLFPLLRGELVIGRIDAAGVRAAYLRDANGRSNVDDLLQPASKEPSGAKTLRFDIRSVKLADLQARVKDDVAGIDAELLLKSLAVARLAWDGERRALAAQSLRMQLAGRSGGLQLLEGSLAVDEFGFDTSGQTLTLRKLQASLKASQAGRPLSLELAWPELSVSGDSLSGSAFSGRFTRGGELPIDAGFKSSQPSGSFKAIRLPALEASVTSRWPEHTLAGTLHADLSVKPAQSTLVFDKLELQGRLEGGKQAPLALALRGRAEVAPQRSSWAVAGELDGKAFSSDGSVTSAGNVPQIVAKARFDALDLNRLLPEAKAAPVKGAAGDSAVDLSGLRLANGEFSLQAGSLAMRQFRLTDARVAATLDAGMLRVTALRGKSWGGELNASAFADARASRVALKGLASGVAIDALLKDVAAKDWLTGHGKIAFDIEAAGRSVNEMKSRLQGSAALQLRDGAVKGINLAKALREAQAAFGLRKDTQLKSSQTEKTDFSELSATFQIADGVARNRDLELKSPLLRLTGEGAIDIGKGHIDYLARAATGPLTVPVRVSGPFDAVDWHIQWAGVLADSVGKKLDNAATQNLLKNKLKGLFK